MRVTVQRQSEYIPVGERSRQTGKFCEMICTSRFTVQSTHTGVFQELEQNESIEGGCDGVISYKCISANA